MNGFQSMVAAIKKPSLEQVTALIKQAQERREPASTVGALKDLLDVCENIEGLQEDRKTQWADIQARVERGPDAVDALDGVEVTVQQAVEPITGGEAIRRLEAMDAPEGLIQLFQRAEEKGYTVEWMLKKINADDLHCAITVWANWSEDERGGMVALVDRIRTKRLPA